MKEKDEGGKIKENTSTDESTNRNKQQNIEERSPVVLDLLRSREDFSVVIILALLFF